jgi:hypothetical protein
MRGPSKPDEEVTGGGGLGGVYLCARPWVRAVLMEKGKLGCTGHGIHV